MHQDATWYGCRPQPRDFVLDGDPVPLLKKEVDGPCLLWPNVWMHQDATWYGGRPQPRGLCVRWGSSPLPKKGAEPPQFSAHVYCGQTAARIEMLLGKEVGLGPVFRPQFHQVSVG